MVSTSIVVNLDLVKSQIREFLYINSASNYWKSTGVTSYMLDTFYKMYNYDYGIYYREFYSEDDFYEKSKDNTHNDIDEYCLRIQRFRYKDIALFNAMFNETFHPNTDSIIIELDNKISALETKLCVGNFIKLSDPKFYEIEINKLIALKEKRKLYETV